MRKLVTLILMLLMTVTVWGQQPGSISSETAKKEINDLLHSPVTRDRAWAAYLIGKNEITEMMPLLYQLAITSTPVSDRDLYKVQASAMDSLIRLNAPLPIEFAEKTYTTFPNETLILLAKKPVENQQFLFSLLQKNIDSFQWVAICNLLTELRSCDLATKLLAEVMLTATIDLYDYSTNLEVGIDGGRFGHGIPTKGESGWPPKTIYILTDSPAYGSIVLARGRHPVYYKTFVSKDGEAIGIGGPIGPRSRSEKDEYIIDYLSEFLGKGINVRELVNFHSKIKFHSIQSYVRELDKVRKQVTKNYRVLVDRFAKQNLLKVAPEVLLINGQVVIKVSDLRTRKSPLPDLPDVEIVSPYIDGL